MELEVVLGSVVVVVAAVVAVMVASGGGSCCRLSGLLQLLFFSNLFLPLFLPLFPPPPFPPPPLLPPPLPLPFPPPPLTTRTDNKILQRFVVFFFVHNRIYNSVADYRFLPIRRC